MYSNGTVPIISNILFILKESVKEFNRQVSD